MPEAAVLRLLVGDIDREIAAVFGPAPPEGTFASATLRASWARLVGTLALGPAPELRACPACHSDCRRAATLCRKLLDQAATDAVGGRCRGARGAVRHVRRAGGEPNLPA